MKRVKFGGKHVVGGQGMDIIKICFVQIWNFQRMKKLKA